METEIQKFRIDVEQRIERLERKLEGIEEIMTKYTICRLCQDNQKNIDKFNKKQANKIKD